MSEHDSHEYKLDKSDRGRAADRALFEILNHDYALVEEIDASRHGYLTVTIDVQGLQDTDLDV